MHADIEPVYKFYENPVNLEQNLLTSIRDGRDHGLHDFLARPIVLGTGVLSTSAAVGTQLTTINLPADFVKHSMIQQKVAGFLAFRGTAKITIVLNANRFQQGRLLATVFPQSDNNLFSYRNQTTGLTALTQLPRVELDVASDTQASFEIPYFSSELAYNLISNIGQQARMDLWIYAPLIAPTGSTTAEFTVWCSYTDVEITFPTLYTGFIAQSGDSGKSKGLKNSVVKSRKSPQTDEAESDRPFSTALGHLISISNIVGRIPLASSVAGTTSWFLSAIKNTAYSWGFSKPLSLDQPTSVVTRPYYRANVATGKDMSYPLGLIEENSVSTLPGFQANDLDEMAVNYVLGRFAFLLDVNWPNTSDVMTLLYSKILNPDLMIGASPFTATYDTLLVRNAQGNTPVSYISNMFSYYRGSFTFKIKFVKTEFHTGRLLFVFAPGVNTLSGKVLNDLNYLYREVVDIRDTNEFIMTCPYASTQPYRQTTNDYYGIFGIFVLNELRNPATVSNSIDMLIEVACASDFELACPQPPTITPATVSSTVPTIGTFSTYWTAQAGESSPQQTGTSAKQLNEDRPIASSNIVNDLSTSSLFCVGERLLSIRQLVKRCTNFMLGSIMNGAGGNTQWTIRPYALYTAIGGTTIANPPVIPDIISYFAPMYAYMRGSMRVKFYSTLQSNSGQNTMRITYNNTTDTNVYAVATTNLTFETPNRQVIPIRYDVTGAGEFQVPFYHRTHSVLTKPAVQGVINYDPFYSPEGTIYGASDDGASLGSTYFSRAGADDFEFGFFLGAPPTVSIDVFNNVGTPIFWW